MVILSNNSSFMRCRLEESIRRRTMLTRNLLKNQERIEYCKETDIVPALSKKLQIPELHRFLLFVMLWEPSFLEP